MKKLSLDNQPIKPTRLYGLVPRGLGTRDVESQTSFTVRLAKAHSLRTLTLMKKEIGAVTGKLWLTKEGRHDGRKYLNGMGVTASDWMSALQTLTGCKRLRELSFLHYKNVIDDKGLMYPNRRWCPKCYDQWLNHGEDVYDPIFWYFEGVQSCLTHEVLLAVNCSKCRGKQPFLPMYPELSICAHCEKTLAGSYTRTRSPTRYDTENIVAELLILVGQHQEISRSDFVERIQRLIKLVANGNCALLSRLVGVSSACIENWSRGLTIPKLKTFSQFCRGLNVGPLKIFASGFPSESFCAEARTRIAENTLWKSSPLDHKYDWNRIEMLLKEILKDNQRPQAVHEVERQMKLGQGKLYLRFPDLCRKITERHYSEAYGRVRARSVPPKILEEFNRSMEEEPAISIDEFARRINYNKDYLYGAYPFISHQIRSRFREYTKRVKKENEIQLLRQALSVDPPINVEEFTKQTGLQEFYLRRHHPELCRQLSVRYIKFRKLQTAERIREMVRSNLSIDPPPSIKTVVNKICMAFGWKGSQTTHIYSCAGDLARAITARKDEYEKELERKKIAHYRKEIRRVVGSLHRKGEYPSFQKIARQVSPQASYTTPCFHKIAVEMRKEFSITIRK